MFPVSISTPKNLKELRRIMPGLPKPVKYLAGGTDLCVYANNDEGLPCSWIDISGLPELQRIKETGKSIWVGAGVKIAGLEESPVIKKWVPVLYAAAGRFASPSLRNMATLGGNCGNASPSADGVCALYAEGATAALWHSGKIKRVPVEKLFKGPKKTALKSGELILGFEIPKTLHFGVYKKLAARKVFSIAKVSVGAAIWADGGVIRDARIALGAVGPTILRAAKTEQYLRGRKVSDFSVEEVSNHAVCECRPIDDHRSDAQYRCAMVGVLLRRALGEMLGKAVVR